MTSADNDTLAVVAVVLWMVGMVGGFLPILREMSYEGFALAIIGFGCLLGSTVLSLVLLWRTS